MKILTLLSLLASFAFGLDTYGGDTTQPCSGGAQTHFYTEKTGVRWHMCTPLGNTYYMLGVFHTNVSFSNTGAAQTYYERIITKYGDMDTWGTAQAARLKAWNFNSVSEYSDYRTWNKIPSMGIINASRDSMSNRYGVGVRPVKNIYNGCNPTYYNPGSRIFPDVFDSAFSSYVNGNLAANVTGLTGMFSSAWYLGTTTDDRDDLFGFGPGPDLNPFSPHPHLGWIALITAPTQASNSAFSVTYTDTTVYAKSQLVTFLTGRYGTIGSLNTAWGSTYTTFGSTGGGWGSGTGFLDEDGRNSWIGNGTTLAGETAAMQTDLNDYLYAMSVQYASVYKTALTMYAPGVLVFGPATLGSDGVTRSQILQAMGEYMDITQVQLQQSQSSSTVQQQLDYTANALGDHPIVSYEILKSNPDSAMGLVPNPSPCVWCSTTQVGRAAIYDADIALEVAATVTATGNKPIVGMKWWEFHDNQGEGGNYGLVDLLDNAYDGVEPASGAVTCSAPIAAYTCGTDDIPDGSAVKPYGDLITGIKATNLRWYASTPGNSGGTTSGSVKISGAVVLR